jgi:hypothetical protein
VDVQSNQWMLFGIDMRHLGQQWLSAWQTLLFAEHSPIRRRLDERVLLVTEQDQRVYQGGRPAGSGELRPACTARLLPDALFLDRHLSLPLAAEAELQSVLAMEVAAGSPFSPDDTVYGWVETGRDEHSLSVSIAIASRASIAQWLRRVSDDAALTEQQIIESAEVWAQCGDAVITLRGFGESERERRYGQRLRRTALFLGGALLLLLLSSALFAVQQRASLERLQQLQTAVQRDSESVAEMRSTLVEANETIRAANAVLVEYPNPHVQLARLTELLGDDAFVAHFAMRGREIRLRGQSSDAAVVMETLAETPGYATVTAPQAITAVGNTGLEQFHLDIELDSQAPSSVDES